MRYYLVLTLLGLLAGCAQEVVVRDSTIARQFSEFNKSGWQVADNNQKTPGGATSDPNVRVVREADFSGLRFNTNFQVDDPRINKQLQEQNQSAAPAAAPAAPAANPQQSGMKPFGATINSPGR